ncbi:endonuclease/exonuclease/phosphatase family protein [Arthrobacter sp. H5]|uniref:endonuclease/exonuclease/phosphatase family protein n=1 Tax=Arthrobacter sp. H5 TaxID=1267973 RepID=UPI00047F9FBC|nr:endonuclease/exonuclease/phosphatase family protein [Arthrobacter sp. H5]
MPIEKPVTRRSVLTAAGAVGLAGAIAGNASPAHAQGKSVIGPAGRKDLHIMSFNIRFDASGTLPGQADYWPERIPALQKVLALEQPTAVGLQEAEFHQLTAVEAALPKHYEMIGYGRDGGSDGEFSAIFYDASRLSLLAWDQFWLSDTPDLIGSATWGNNVTRIVTWGRFLDASTGRELVLINTHFDHQSGNARIRSAQAIVNLVRTINPPLPTILTGDFNANAGASGAYSTLVDSDVFHDTWTTAGKKVTPAYGTFPNYKDPIEGADRIDWILATPDVQVLETAINTFRQDDRYPSDHVPVQALVRLT